METIVAHADWLPPEATVLQLERTAETMGQHGASFAHALPASPRFTSREASLARHAEVQAPVTQVETFDWQVLQVSVVMQPDTAEAHMLLRQLEHPEPRAPMMEVAMEHPPPSAPPLLLPPLDEFDPEEPPDPLPEDEPLLAVDPSSPEPLLEPPLEPPW
jgi:hypothetical protein